MSGNANAHYLRRIAEALEDLVELSRPPKVSPMRKTVAPTWPYSDAPQAPPWYPVTKGKYDVSKCSCQPQNGGSGVCNCVMSGPTITC